MELEPILFRGKIIGHLRSDKVYITHREAKHFFVKYQGFGLSYNVLIELKAKECKKIILIYNKADGTQEVFTTYPNKSFEVGEVYEGENDDWQRILPIKHFNMAVTYDL